MDRETWSLWDFGEFREFCCVREEAVCSVDGGTLCWMGKTSSWRWQLKVRERGNAQTGQKGKEGGWDGKETFLSVLDPAAEKKNKNKIYFIFLTS